MLLNPLEFHAYCKRVSELKEGGVAIDFETNSLNPRDGKAFIIGVSHSEMGEVSCLLAGLSRETLELLCSNPRIKYAAHNAKFEMGFLRRQFGVEIRGPIWDTEVFAMTEDNSHTKRMGGKGYGLQACAERIGETKYPPMLAWLKANGPKYHEAPMDLVVPYVEQDARISRILMDWQLCTLRSWEMGSPTPISKVVKLEMATTRNLFEMEDTGIPLDVDYCMEALIYEEKRAEKASKDFEDHASERFVDSAKCFEPIFKAQGLSYSRTDKGNPSFDGESLKPHAAHPIVQAILNYRDAQKRVSSYWMNLLAANVSGKIHPSIRQAGAASFRMSIVDPAAQTWPDDSEDLACRYPIRRALIAESGCLIVSMDYAQMELRLICDEASDMGMIRAIQSGIDFHQETADAASVKRGLAKNGRFAKLYGAGIQTVADTLGVSYEVAERVCRAIDESSPQVKAYSDALIRQARSADYGTNWLGRRYLFKRGFEYKYPNFRIQGGCGEILRIAIDDITAFLRASVKGNTKLLLPIHDELVFNWDLRDMDLIPKVKGLMIAAHRNKRHLDMDVSVNVGPNFHDLEEWRDGSAG